MASAIPRLKFQWPQLDLIENCFGLKMEKMFFVRKCLTKLFSTHILQCSIILVKNNLFVEQSITLIGKQYAFHNEIWADGFSVGNVTFFTVWTHKKVIQILIKTEILSISTLFKLFAKV